jgi:hypothetical protein
VLFTVDLARIGRIATKIAHGLYCLRYGPGAPREAFAPVWLSGPGDEPPQFIVAAMWNWPGIRRKRWTEATTRPSASAHRRDISLLAI